MNWTAQDRVWARSMQVDLGEPPEDPQSDPVIGEFDWQSVALVWCEQAAEQAQRTDTWRRLAIAETAIAALAAIWWMVRG